MSFFKFISLIGYCICFRSPEWYFSGNLFPDRKQVRFSSNGVSNSNAPFNSSSCSAISAISAVTLNSHQSSTVNSIKRKLESDEVKQQHFLNVEKISPVNTNGMSSTSSNISNSTPNGCESTVVAPLSTTTPSSVSTIDINCRSSINPDIKAAAALIPPASNPSLDPRVNCLPISSVLTDIPASRSSPSHVRSSGLILPRAKSPLAYQKTDNFHITANAINVNNFQENENTHNNGPREDIGNNGQISSVKHKDHTAAQYAS